MDKLIEALDEYIEAYLKDRDCSDYCMVNHYSAKEAAAIKLLAAITKAKDETSL